MITKEKFAHRSFSFVIMKSSMITKALGRHRCDPHCPRIT